jgi:tetratricopeptide (TPR) repeat protein
MAGRNRKKKSKKDKKRTSGKVQSPKLSLESLRRDFSDPKKLERATDLLAESMRHEPELAKLRFPAEKLLDALDDVAEHYSDQLEAMPDILDRRVFILNNAIKPFLNRKFVNKIETALMKHLENVKTSPKDFRAVGAGLFFLEIHKRQSDSPGNNPLWNIIFDISYDEAMATSGGTIKTADDKHTKTGPPEFSRDTARNISSIPEGELSDDSIATLKEALHLIDSNTVDFGLSIDMVVLGLRKLALHVADTPEKRAQEIQNAFAVEFGARQLNILASHLEHAIDTFTGAKKQNFQTVSKALKLLAPQDNPVVFAIYYKSVTECIRFIDKDEGVLLDGIISDPYSVHPILALGRYLLTQDAPNRALNAFTAAIEAEPSEELTRLGAGIACKMGGSTREARLHWDRAARLYGGYLPPHHPVIKMVMELVELDDDAELPQKAYNFLFFDEVTDEEFQNAKTDSDSDPI